MAGALLGVQPTVHGEGVADDEGRLVGASARASLRRNIARARPA
jgi:hypothetical protein